MTQPIVEPGRQTRLRRHHKIAFYAAYLALLLLVLAGIAEVIARRAGYAPYHAPRAKVVTVVPGGKLYRVDSVLGYVNLPGAFTITLPTGYTYRGTNLPNGLRITHPLVGYDLEHPSVFKRKEIWIFGCSFTYGQTINDSETFAWLLQEAYPQYEIVNFGTNGYGTLHSYLQFKQRLQVGRRPALVVLVYAIWHDERNTFLRKRQKSVAPSNVLGVQDQPAARLVGDSLVISKRLIGYKPWPLMNRLAAVHMLETRYNEIEDRIRRSHEVTKAIWKRFSELAKQNGAQFLVGSLGDPAPIAGELQALGIRATDMWVDIDRPGYNNRPHDGHPSPRANIEYARKLKRGIDQLLSTLPQKGGA